jgi:hypothetical protein
LIGWLCDTGPYRQKLKTEEAHQKKMWQVVLVVVFLLAGIYFTGSLALYLTRLKASDIIALQPFPPNVVEFPLLAAVSTGPLPQANIWFCVKKEGEELRIIPYDRTSHARIRLDFTDNELKATRTTSYIHPPPFTHSFMIVNEDEHAVQKWVFLQQVCVRAIDLLMASDNTFVDMCMTKFVEAANTPVGRLLYNGASPDVADTSALSTFEQTYPFFRRFVRDPAQFLRNLAIGQLLHIMPGPIGPRENRLILSTGHPSGHIEFRRLKQGNVRLIFT